MVELFERVNDFLVSVNNYPYHRTEVISKQKGITRIYGKDGDKEKINYVTYSKDHYNKDYIENKIIPQYEDCPLCKIGRNLNFKYSKKDNNVYSKNKSKKFENKMNGKLAAVGRWFKQPDVAGQGIAQIPKFGISLFTSELGNKIINSTIGAIGNILNEKYGGRRKALLRSLFTNMMFTFADPTANQIREIKRNWQDLVGGLKMRNFSTAFGALIEEPEEVVGAIRSITPSMKGFSLPSLKSFKKNMSVTSDNQIQSVDTGIVSTYKSSFGDPLDSDDLVDY